MRKTLLILIMAVATICSTSVAQRHITPVVTTTGIRHELEENKNKKKDKHERPASVVEYTDQNGKTILIDTIAGTEYVDSAAILEASKHKAYTYPLMHAVTVGINVWDPLMRCFGQHYGLADAWVELSLHNRIKPVFEFGLGTAKNTPADGNFTYTSPTAPFFKLGVNYNFLYNSNQAYQFHVGLRYGFTSFKYDITDVTVSSGDYWGEPTTFNIPKQTSTIGYGEFLFGLKVQIYKNISMGWNIKYHFRFHESNNLYGKPWYIPGYGTRSTALTGALSIMYTLPLNKKGILPLDNNQH